ncbi:MAG: monovalent cation/H+ antiporter complex subunit F [Devosia sp.]
MSGSVFLDMTTAIALVLLGIAFAFTLIRLLLGPSLADRILCLDTITLLAAGAIGVFAIRSAIYVYVDIAVAVGLLGFLSTAALARYLLSRSNEEHR